MAQQKRSVKIAFPGGTAPQEIQSNATTWGVLKKELMDELNQSFDNQKVRDHETNHHYDDSNAVLPAGSIKLLVSTDKNKSGMTVTKRNYHKAPFGELRTFAKKMTGKAPNGKDACIAALDAHYGQSSPAAATPAKAKKAAPKKETSKKEAPAAAAKETSTPGAKSTAKASKGGLEARVVALEKKWEAYFGDEEDASFMAAAKNLH